MVTRLREIDQVLYKWYDAKGKILSVDFGVLKEALSSKIANDVYRDHGGVATPSLGYRWFASTAPAIKRDQRTLTFNMSAGGSSIYQSNCAYISTLDDRAPDPSIISYDIMSRILLALAETFDATRAYVYSEMLGDLWPQSREWHPKLPLSWISYVAPAFAPLVKPPDTSIVERRPNGGLLMAATKEIFDVDNPVHMAVARDIELAVAPFNALPWPPEARAVQDSIGRGLSP